MGDSGAELRRLIRHPPTGGGFIPEFRDDVRRSACRKCAEKTKGQFRWISVGGKSSRSGLEPYLAFQTAPPTHCYCIQQTTQSAGGLVTATASCHNSDVQRSSPGSTENVSVVHSASIDARTVQSLS